MIAQSVPRPIAIVTNGEDNCAGCEYASWGATAASDSMPGQPMPLTSSSRAAMISKEINWQTSEPWAS
jgi:hypothetical protein